ncbi:MAG: hypothetical protein KatS3mg114_1075 [Planctomycetaceae bacterium]|nr:MAG: hypothetical protein KatS3mg114_1075 [Planctomycetaceae bacterium]
MGLCGLGVTLAGSLGGIAEYDPLIAFWQLIVILAGTLMVFKPGLRLPIHNAQAEFATWSRGDTLGVMTCSSITLLVSVLTGQLIGPLPPAYHDEYSYLFGAQSLLAGHWTWPLHPTHPELFSQYHVLNEKVMASRYYPGTSAWLACWLALGNPWWGQWVAASLSTALLYMTGWELGGRRTAWWAGLLLALSPGLALFDNLLLAHAPTLLGLSWFLWAFIRGWRQPTLAGWLLSGTGLAFAMLCRPATAAGCALPFGLAWLWRAWSCCRPTNSVAAPTCNHGWLIRSTIGLGLPLLAGWLIMLVCNRAVTGDWFYSPYQQYTDLYTPRHVYGLYNIERGEQRLGPKVLEAYDRWAENLTPRLAWYNVLIRGLSSALWTIDLPLWTMTLAAWPWVWGETDRRWRMIMAAIVALHAIHWPYWYVGIMGWHYVFETAPLWCLLAGRLTHRAVTTAHNMQQPVLAILWRLLIISSWVTMYGDHGEIAQSRWARGASVIAYPRQQHAAFRQWLLHQVGSEPALVLLLPEDTNPHLDFVINPPGLQGPLLIGRLQPERDDLRQIIRDFPDRRVWVCWAEQRRLMRAEDYLVDKSHASPAARD